MVGILSRFLLGWPIFRGELLVSGRVFFVILGRLSLRCHKIIEATFFLMGRTFAFEYSHGWSIDELLN